MVVLDATIVNIALPSAQQDLGFSDDSPPVDRHRVRARLRLACCCSAAASATSSAASGPSSAACSASPAPRPSAAPRSSSACSSPPAPLQGVFGALLAPVGAVAADDHVHRPARARQGVRHLRRDRRRRRRRRPAARRHPHRVAVVALVPVREPRCSPSRRRSPRCRLLVNQAPGDRPRARPPGHARPRSPACSRSSTASRTPRRTAGAHPVTIVDAGRRASCCSARSSRIERARRAPAAAAARRRRPHPRRLLPRRSGIAGVAMFARVPVPDLLPAAAPRASSPIQTGLAFLPMTAAIIATADVGQPRGCCRASARGRCIVARHAARRGRRWLLARAARRRLQLRRPRAAGADPDGHRHGPDLRAGDRRRATYGVDRARHAASPRRWSTRCSRSAARSAPRC